MGVVSAVSSTLCYLFYYIESSFNGVALDSGDSYLTGIPALVVCSLLSSMIFELIFGDCNNDSYRDGGDL